MKALLLITILLISLPAQAAFWPFTDRCDDIEEMVTLGEIPSTDEISYYFQECSGEKLESLGDSATDSAGDATDKAAELWQTLKQKASE